MASFVGIAVFILLQLYLVQGYYYQIETKTGDSATAGTDSDVQIIIYGNNGRVKTSSHYLESGNNDFESGHTDRFIIEDKIDVGRPEYVELKRTSTFGGKWELIWVRLLYNGQRYLFKYDAWLPPKIWVRINGKCKAGFLLDSLDKCVDINECSENPCKENSVCKNFPGSFTCECTPGFEHKDRFSCKDTNECHRENKCDFKSSTCVNHVGHYSCRCKPGFKSLSKFKCIDKDECAEGGHTCNSTTSTCANLHGDFYCICKAGYHQGQSLKLCLRDECTPLALPYKSIIEPARCTQGKANYYGDVCTVRCENGYTLENPKANSISCGAGGRWSGATPRCTAIKCPALSAPRNSSLLPSSCTTEGNRFQGKCTYICNQGYQLSGSPYRECRADGSWTGSTPTCIKVVVKPWIRCPIDIVVDLLPGKRTADVSSLWKVPNYQGDILLVEPPSAKANYRFPAGQTKITWTTRNAAGSDSCSLLVIVNDKELPKIVTPCPASPVGVLTTSNSAKVTWNEPTFSDNVGVTKVTSTRRSGETFTLGSWNVYYTAYDKADNNVRCQFVVIVKLKGCPQLESPFGGSKQCQKFGKISFCTVHCPVGSQIYENPSKFSVWTCNNGKWDPSPKAPDCVATTPTSDGESCSGNQVKMSIITSTATNKYCANCPRGMYSSNGKCLQCTPGKYQDQQGSTACKNCGEGYSSLAGATDIQKCRVVCRPGHYSVDGMDPGCQLCPKDTYQNNPNAKSCIACPPGTATISSGNARPEDCGARPVIFQVTPKTKTIDERESTSITCYASGIPQPNLRLKFRKKFPAEFLGKETRTLIKDSNGKVIGIKLTITSATFENTGHYECTADNPFGKTIQVSTLNVNKVFGSGGGASFDADF